MGGPSKTVQQWPPAGRNLQRGPMSAPAASLAAETARAQCCYARRSRPWPGWAKPETLASQAVAAVPRAVDPRRASGCHPQCGMVGIGNRDMVASSPAGAPSPAPAPRVGGRIRHDRSPDRRSPGRGHPALARTPAPRTHGKRRIPPSAAAHCRPGTPPVRPDSLTWRLATVRDGGRFKENAHRAAVLPPATARRRFSACRTELAYMRFFRWGPKPSKDQDERWPFMITA
jgi:hypothetical protein